VVGGFTASVSYLLAGWLLKTPEYWWVFALLGALLPVFSINSLVLSVLNGLGDVRRLTVFNIAQSVMGLGVAVALPWLFGLAGALGTAVLSSTVVFVVLWPELRRHAWLRFGGIVWASDRENLRLLGNFALMAMVSGVCTPVAQIVVRGWIIERCNADEAGYWQALMRFSSAYLIFFTTTLSVYFLPKFSALDRPGVVRELKRGYALILPVLAGLFFMIWFSREWLVPMLFSTRFQPMKELLVYQLTGDFLKIGSWIMSFLMLARAKTGMFIVSEIIFNVLYVGLSFTLIGTDGQGGARGALIAWIVLYALYWAFVAAALPRMLSGDGPGPGAGGLALEQTAG
jgi:PST family polysaccharide transporter